MVNKRSTKINLVSPDSLLTNQIASDFNNEGSEIISPETAEIKPLYVTVENQEKTANIGVQIKNNYAGSVTDVKILGKIPYTGNTYVISKGNLNSEFETKMDKKGIQVPTELDGKVKVYYSESINPSNELTDVESDWKEATQVNDWDSIKSFLIDFGDYVVKAGKDYVFNYSIRIPNNIDFNKIAYSHHGVYFSLITNQGKYNTSTEPNKLGFRISEKYNLEITKNKKGEEKVVPGATYKITEEGAEESKTAVTDINGTMKFNDLYAEKVYILQETKTPKEYELSDEIIKFVGHIDRTTGNLSIEVKNEETDGITSDRFSVSQADHKVTLKVEDEVNARLEIKKVENGTENEISKVRYKITGKGLPESGKTIITNTQGEAKLDGLKIGTEYKLEEVKADGYYLANPIIFKINHNENNFNYEIVNNQEQLNIKDKKIEVAEDSIPTLKLTIENEKIPTCDLELLKVKKTEDVIMQDVQTEDSVENSQITPLLGAKFKLYKDNKELGTYETDDQGKLTIPNLYEYVEGKNFEATYLLKEVLAPTGYTKVKDITFKIQNEQGELKFKEELQEGQTEKKWNLLENNKIQVISRWKYIKFNNRR